jgi:hypothetical protein
MAADNEYAGAPPRLLLGLAEHQQLQHADDADAAAAALSLEERFASVVQELMRDEINVGDALLAMKESCAAYAEHLRYAARPWAPSRAALLAMRAAARGAGSKEEKAQAVV